MLVGIDGVSNPCYHGYTNSKTTGNIMKNECGKTRPVGNPYEVWEGSGWTWKVLKKYQNPEKEKSNPYARWLCDVVSPFAHDRGDVYVKDITEHAERVSYGLDNSAL
jgi:hypothetical protein